MVAINYATREVTCKIVYYGPGLSGKTTNLQMIHDKVPQNTRGKMISLATEADRTLYFDFLPINIGTISGFAAKFQLYTVPGQVYYNATRKLVLRGTDGLVFVADSQPDKMDENIESLNNMKENLAEYGYDIKDLPIVIQYNKRDLPNILPVAELEAKLNELGWKHFEAAAVSGTGVFDTLKMIIKLVLDKARSSQSNSARSKPSVAAAPASRAEGGADQAPPAVHTETKTEVAPRSASDTAPIRQAAYQAESVREAEEQAARPEHEFHGDEAPIVRESRQAAESHEDREAGPSPEQAAIEEENWGQDRPYPGSTGRIPRRGKRITVSDFQPASKDEDISTLKSGLSETADGDDTENDQKLPTPMMARSNRVVKKKRGFFKRLFGIKQ
nr:hypothetical protein [candidate division Zixibacteria bacterium]